MSQTRGFIEKLAELAATGEPLATVTLADVVGSAPQEVGGKMIVSPAGLVHGTVGGGRVELQAITHAQAMLADCDPKRPTTELVEWNLQRDVGMTCGGVVRLLFECYQCRPWNIVMFGAGHVAGAVARALLPLECRLLCIDPRPDWLARLPQAPQLQTRCVDDMPAEVGSLPADAFVLCMTMGHRTDRPILEAIFRQAREFPYLGVIGSRAKRATVLRELAAAGIAAEVAARFRCPIGLPVGGNLPAEIAVSVVAELLQVRDRWRRGESAQFE